MQVARFACCHRAIRCRRDRDVIVDRGEDRGHGDGIVGHGEGVVCHHHGRVFVACFGDGYRAVGIVPLGCHGIYHDRIAFIGLFYSCPVPCYGQGPACHGGRYRVFDLLERRADGDIGQRHLKALVIVHRYRSFCKRLHNGERVQFIIHIWIYRRCDRRADDRAVRAGDAAVFKPCRIGDAVRSIGHLCRNLNVVRALQGDACLVEAVRSGHTRRCSAPGAVAVLFLILDLVREIAKRTLRVRRQDRLAAARLRGHADGQRRSVLAVNLGQRAVLRRALRRDGCAAGGVGEVVVMSELC